VKRILSLLAAAGTLALPALAQESPAADVTCAEFAAMTTDDQMMALAALEPAPGNAPTADPAAEESVTAVVAACDEHPDMMLGDAAKEALRE
jgi:hypothetical protein